MSFFTYIILQFIFYSIFIFLVHTVFHYIQDNYTTKKEVDLVKIQQDHYKNILNEIENIKYNQELSPNQMILHNPVNLENSLLDVLMEEDAI